MFFSEYILEDLSPYDVRQLVMMEDEMEETKASKTFSVSGNPVRMERSEVLNYVFNEV